MILTIICAILIVMVVIIMIGLYKEDHNPGVFYLLALPVMIVLLATVFLTNASDINETEVRRYEELSMLAEHYDELSAEVKIKTNKRVNEWNKMLENRSGLFLHFTTPDYSKYIITIENNEL